MAFLLALFAALVISVSLIPLLIRLAPRLGLVDQPDPRKVHRVPIPRVGGIGIVLGALVPLSLLTPLDPEIIAYLFGALVLLGFGLWDDARGLSPYVKFIGQFLAVAPAVYLADVYVAQLPFLGDVMPAWLGRGFTTFAMVGVVNAINTSDGLDGLAGGLTLLSLAAMGFLAYDANGPGAMAIAACCAGGVLGFLRYNTHPAGTFMGDSGSQFLGFTLGFLAVLLTQRVATALSPALPALLLGLPVADLLYVMCRRLAHGASAFRPDKNHVHHRLLDIGFDHYEAVLIIYAIQTSFVVAAVWWCFESDVLVLSLYLGVGAALFGWLLSARRRGWRVHRAGDVSRVSVLVQSLRVDGWLTAVPVGVVVFGLSALLLIVSLMTDSVPRDVGIGAVLLAVLLLLHLARSRTPGLIVPRTVAYVTCAFAVYLQTRPARLDLPWFETVELAYFGALAIAIALAARFSPNRNFQPNPMDFLVIVVVLGLALLSHGEQAFGNLGAMTVKLVVLFYGCELILSHARTRWNPLNLSALAALGVLGARAFL